MHLYTYMNIYMHIHVYIHTFASVSSTQALVEGTTLKYSVETASSFDSQILHIFCVQSICHKVRERSLGRDEGAE